MTSPSHLLWIPGGAAAGFLASFLFGDLLTMPLDLYYMVYVAIVIGFLGVYVKTTRLNPMTWISRRLAWGLVMGIVGGLILTRGVLAQPETPRLSGAFLWWALFWRGLVYGSADGLLLIAFPWIVTWRALGAEDGTLAIRLRAGALALLAILFVTTAYHLGYRDFRSAKILQPNVGATIAALPTLVTANPLGAPISHVFLHVTAVLHSPATDLFLPPHRQAGPLPSSSARDPGTLTGYR